MMRSALSMTRFARMVMRSGSPGPTPTMYTVPGFGSVIAPPGRAPSGVPERTRPASNSCARLAGPPRCENVNRVERLEAHHVEQRLGPGDRDQDRLVLEAKGPEARDRIVERI